MTALRLGHAYRDWLALQRGSIDRTRRELEAEAAELLSMARERGGDIELELAAAVLREHAHVQGCLVRWLDFERGARDVAGP